MAYRKSKILILVSAFLLVAGCVGNLPTPPQRIDLGAPSSKTAQAQSALKVYLVRHAEKEVDGTSDPALTQGGLERAVALAAILDGASISHIYTTDYKRTRETALPTLQRAGLENFTFYEGNDLAALADKILNDGGTKLVVGHSNTTGELATLLIGRDAPLLTEEDYDRLYIVTREPDQSLTLSIVRFGPF